MKTVLLEITGDNKIFVKEDTLFVLVRSDYSKKEDAKFDFIFNTPHVKANVISLFNVPANGYYSLETHSSHITTDTSCDVKVKGILKDRASSNFIGKIKINKEAVRTVSYLHDHVLVTGNNTKNHSQPILEIEANDVQASHGATTGRVGTEDLYYLMSRGLSKNEAEELIITGFFAELLDQIDDKSVLQEVKSKLGV